MGKKVQVACRECVANGCEKCDQTGKRIVTMNTVPAKEEKAVTESELIEEFAREIVELQEFSLDVADEQARAENAGATEVEILKIKRKRSRWHGRIRQMDLMTEKLGINGEPLQRRIWELEQQKARAGELAGILG